MSPREATGLDSHGPPVDDPIAAIVLAAGRSSRMGSHKLLLPLGDRPLVAHVVAAACASSAEPVLVVVGHEAERVRRALPPGSYRLIANERYAEGMATSLQVGIAAVPQACAGALVLLGDQPLVSSRLLDRLIAAARAHPQTIIAPTYDGRRGSPVYFARPFFAELGTVTGDEGGRSVLARHAERVVLIACDDLAMSLDVDDPEDYTRIQQVWATWRRGRRAGE